MAKSTEYDRKELFDWVREQLNKLAIDFNKKFPNAGKGMLNYILFNSLKYLSNFS